MIVKKTTTRSYEVRIFGIPAFSTHGAFIEARKRNGLKTEKFTKCFICEKKFKPEEDIFVVSVTPRVGNRFICVDCARKNGNEYTNKKEEHEDVQH